MAPKAKQNGSLRIHSVIMRNLMRVRSVEVGFDKHAHLIVIGGRNAQGKTSFMDGLEAAFTTGKISDQPIHDGAKRAEDTIVLMDDDGNTAYTIEKIVVPSGTKVTVYDSEGRIIPDARALLDDMIGKGHGFDPALFARQCETAAGRRAQFETLKSLCGMDFTAHDAERQQVYNERTGVNTTVRGLQAQLAATTHYPDAPAAEVSLSELSDQLQAANQQQLEVDRLRQRFSAQQQVILAKRARVKELHEEASRLIQQATIQEGEVDAQEAALSEIKTKGCQLVTDAVDPEPIKAQIADLETTNRKVRENQKHLALSHQEDEAQHHAEELTAALERMDKEKLAQIAAAPMPIPELSINHEEEIVYYNGRPLSVASSAEKLRVSVAMGIAMLRRLKVILVREGSHLDADNLRMVGEMATAAGVQVFAERVGTEGASFILEDGEVADEETLQQLCHPAPDQLPVTVGETPEALTVGSGPGF